MLHKVVYKYKLQYFYFVITELLLLNQFSTPNYFRSVCFKCKMLNNSILVIINGLMYYCCYMLLNVSNLSIINKPQNLIFISVESCSFWDLKSVFLCFFMSLKELQEVCNFRLKTHFQSGRLRLATHPA